jgi:predicted RNA-binding Zn-ribbon protein involved in translation (DUF1610 family)
MELRVGQTCREHSDPFDCPDCVIAYSQRFREYGLIIHDDGSSVYSIRYCPWCGAKLPESMRDRWFAELEQMGIDPSTDEVPVAFQSSAWWSVLTSRST